MGLIAIVFGSAVGGGIFDIAQNMASDAGLGAVIIAWGITGLGVLFLVLTFKILSDRRPDLNQGIYQYAKEGFGNYIGFNIAWGYWLCVALGNVAFAVMLNDSFGAFFPILLKHGFPTIIFGMSLIWIMYFIVLRGVMSASFLNTIMTVLKFTAIIVIIVILLIFFRMKLFTTDFWGHMSTDGFHNLGSVGNQIMSTMLVTMFCFVGIEGAVMLSSYAKKPSDVGKASVIGFYLALMIYALIAILCYGVMTRPELAELHDPSVAYVLKHCCGEWAYYFVICTVIVSLLSAWIAWTLLCAQTPYGAATVKIMPTEFLKKNKHNVPSYGLCAASIFMSLFIILVCTAPNVYMAALNLTTVMVLPAYLFCGAFLWKATIKTDLLNGELTLKEKAKFRLIGVMCTIYCLWCIFAGGMLLFMVSSIFYFIGTFFYYRTCRESAISQGKTKVVMFPRLEDKAIFLLISAATIVSIIMLCLGKVDLSS